MADSNENLMPFEQIQKAQENAIAEKDREAREYADNNVDYGRGALIFVARFLAVIILVWYCESLKSPTGEYVSEKTSCVYAVTHSVISGKVSIVKKSTGDEVYSGHLSIGTNKLQVNDADNVQRVAFVTNDRIYWPATGEEYDGTIWRRQTKNPLVLW